MLGCQRLKNESRIDREKSYLGAVLLAAIIFISVLVFDMSDDTNPDSEKTFEK